METPKGRNDTGSSRPPFRHARRCPPHLAVLRRPGFVRAAPALPGTTRIRLPSASPPCCDRTEAKVSHLHSNNSASRRSLEGVKKDEIDTALGYFENNAPRMRYHWFRQCGLFVGSGVVEASCKTIVGQRLKQSGMHWTVGGADAIIALRCREASSTWEAICNTPHTQTRTA